MISMSSVVIEAWRVRLYVSVSCGARGAGVGRGRTEGLLLQSHLQVHAGTPQHACVRANSPTPRPTLEATPPTLPSISPAFLVEFSMALMREDCSEQLFSSMQLYSVCGEHGGEGRKDGR